MSGADYSVERVEGGEIRSWSVGWETLSTRIYRAELWRRGRMVASYESLWQGYPVERMRAVAASEVSA